MTPVDASSDTSTPEAGNDSGPPDGSIQDASTDADADADAGPTCVIPDSGALSGQVDQTFNTGTKSVGNSFAPTSAVIDASGNVYIVGNATNCVDTSSGSDLAVIRLKNDGSLDTFGPTAGKPVCVSMDVNEIGYAIALDPNGNIVIAGLSGHGPGSTGHYFASVARIDTTGALDTTFNATGMVDVLGPDGGVAAGSGQGFASAFGLAINSSGKIFVAGGDDNGGASGPTTGYLTRLASDGSIDQGFAGGGTYTDSTVDAFFHVAEDGSGGAFVVGQTKAAPRRIVVKHIDASGSLVTSFGTNGVATIPTTDAGTNLNDHGRSILLDPDGTLLVAGNTLNVGSIFGNGTAAAVARLTSAGTLDPTFGAGTTLTAYPSLIFDSFYMWHTLGALCDGRVLLGGRFDSDAGQDMAVIELDSKGVLVPSFGTAGLARFVLPGNQIAVAAAQDPKTGKIVLIGGAPAQILAVRFLP